AALPQHSATYGPHAGTGSLFRLRADDGAPAMTHSPSDRSEDTADYHVPGEHRQRHERRRHNDRVTHTAKVIFVWTGGVLTTGLMIGLLWRAGDALYSFTHSVTASAIANTQTATAMQQMTKNLSDIAAQVSQLLIHDSIQDAALSDDHKQIV